MWLKAVVEEAVELLAYELRTADVELTLDLEEGLPRLWADPHQLNQVLVNLLANANQAMRRFFRNESASRIRSNRSPV